ncbi:hypothetical protein [Sphingomonas sp. ID1715]|nr:hypothetical protein [Sphingomonas sp. ID1715]
MMIEHEDHDRTPDRLSTRMLASAFVAFGLFAMASSIAFLVRLVLS